MKAGPIQRIMLTESIMHDKQKEQNTNPVP